MILYPLLEVVVVALSGLGFHVRDLGLLDSALVRAQTRLYGQDAYPTLSLKAAAIVHSVINNHPMVDGNKRSAWVILNFFLVKNNRALSATQDEAYSFIMSIAEKRIELEEIAAWLEDHMIPLIPKG
jgi:death-on-curing protein